ncbi:hypothetical protein M0802_015530 [Mischocyttarus mexicanus]|nr:hypothetical protein M0802_015530 [Mischocyttarus mexicanus]
MKKVFALIILMGLLRKNEIYNYWSTPLLETPVFGTTMSRDRFLRICTFLHFSDNSTAYSTEKRLIKVQEIIDYFSNKLKSVYEPGQKLSLDEGIIPWRGRLRFRTYNPDKIVKYGILNRMICESKTGYICSFILYCGKSVSLENTILELLNPYLNKWHHIYTDNVYNSVKLASTLLLHKIRVCGTIRLNREVPNVLRNIKLRHGETRYKRRGEIMIQVWNSNKKRNIQMISTIHNADIIDSNKIDRNTQLFIKKQHCIIDCNQYMNGVDLADQYLAYNLIFRKTLKWTKKVFFYLLHCAIFNSFRIYQILNSQSKIRFHDFMLSLAESWIEGSPDISHSNTEEATNQPLTSTRTPRFDSTKRLSGNIKHHELMKISNNGKTVKKRCRVCYSHKIRQDTSYMCKSCKVPLHIEKCFQANHTKKKIPL